MGRTVTSRGHKGRYPAMRSILLHIHNDPCLEARLQVSLDLARAFGGHLTCVQVVPFAFIMPGDFYGTMAAEIAPVLQKNADELRDTLAGRLEHEDVAWDWLQEDGLAIDYLLEKSSLSDVAILGACEPLATGKAPSNLAGDLAIRGRTPVLMVPAAVRSFDVTGPAVVAWDGSLEAAHALKAALPLLARARSVVLATVAEEREPGDGEIPSIDGAEYLARHGIECEMLELPLNGGSVAQVLASAATAREASYLVMGAYGHARWIETVWGGVTRELFANPPLPILACH
jgi:nucleotide-binding universal stress UspA family protein